MGDAEQAHGAAAEDARVRSADRDSAEDGRALHASPLPLPHPLPQGGREEERLRRASKGEGEARGDAVDWAAAREAYELTNETVASICARFGVTRYRLERERTAAGWTVRPQIARPGKALLLGGRSVGSDAIEYRLNRLVTTGLAMLEKRIGEEGMTEANARTLTELARAQEIRMRSKRNEKAAKAREKKNSDAGYDFRDDPAWLDAEIARRLDRLGGGPAEAGGAAGRDDGRGEAGLSRDLDELGKT